MYEILPRTDGRRVAIRLRGELSKQDLQDIRAYLKGLLAHHSPLQVLFVVTEWTGWHGWGALWEDVKTDLRLNEDVERLAMVGGGLGERLMTAAMKPFAHATVRWFPPSALEDAWNWLPEE